MKLFELTGVKKHYDLNDEELLQHLKTYHGNSIGRGHFSRVIITKNHAYKLWLHDTGYEKFIEYSLKHKDNPYLPKFKSNIKKLTSFFKRPNSFPDKINYIKMEVLQPLHLGYLRGKYDIKPAKFFNLIESSDFEYDLSLAIDDALETGDDMSNDTIQTIRDLNKIMTDLIKQNKLELNDTDLSTNNFMLRGDQLVLTDPLAIIDDRSFMSNVNAFIDDSRADDSILITGPRLNKNDTK